MAVDALQWDAEIFPCYAFHVVVPCCRGQKSRRGWGTGASTWPSLQRVSFKIFDTSSTSRALWHDHMMAPSATKLVSFKIASPPGLFFISSVMCSQWKPVQGLIYTDSDVIRKPKFHPIRSGQFNRIRSNWPDALWYGSAFNQLAMFWGDCSLKCGARCDLFSLLSQDVERSWRFKAHLHLLQSQRQPHYSNECIALAASLTLAPPKSGRQRLWGGSQLPRSSWRLSRANSTSFGKLVGRFTSHPRSFFKVNILGERRRVFNIPKLVVITLNLKITTRNICRHVAVFFWQN